MSSCWFEAELRYTVTVDATTDHAWLVVLGYVAQVLGLVAGLGEVLPAVSRPFTDAAVMEAIRKEGQFGD